MINYALIRNIETDKNIAVIAHSPEVGRVVFKVRDSDSNLLERALGFHYDRSIIVQEPVEINGFTISKRRRSIPKDRDYLNNLLDKAVRVPYEVRLFSETDEGQLDTFLDKLAEEYLA
jgi:hypothetical protein